MPAPTRVSSLTVSAFSVGGSSLLGIIENATMTIRRETYARRVPSSAAVLRTPLRYRWELTGDAAVDANPKLMTLALSGGDVVVAITCGATGATTYGGTGKIKTLEHRVPHGSVQTERFVVTGYSALTVGTV